MTDSAKFRRQETEIHGTQLENISNFLFERAHFGVPLPSHPHLLIFFQPWDHIVYVTTLTSLCFNTNRSTQFFNPIDFSGGVIPKIWILDQLTSIGTLMWLCVSYGRQNLQIKNFVKFAKNYLVLVTAESLLFLHVGQWWQCWLWQWSKCGEHTVTGVWYCFWDACGCCFIFLWFRMSNDHQSKWHDSRNEWWIVGRNEGSLTPDSSSKKLKTVMLSQVRDEQAHSKFLGWLFLLKFHLNHWKLLATDRTEYSSETQFY